QVEIDFIKTVGSQLRRYEIDEASIRCTNGWDLELMRPDPAVEARTIERGRSVQRAHAVVGRQTYGTDRRTMLAKVRARKRIGLSVQHQINVALLIERHSFGPMAAGTREAERFDEGTQRSRVPRVDGELENRHAVQPRRSRAMERR